MGIQMTEWITAVNLLSALVTISFPGELMASSLSKYTGSQVQLQSVLNMMADQPYKKR